MLGAGAGSVGAAGVRLADPELAGYVVVDFPGFDGWLEEDPVMGHPRDPFSRMQVADVALSYEAPLEEVALVRGRVCFFAERADIVLDGQRAGRPRTP